MINIDSVYQKVLALTNKEQRGYITPQEFNLLANQAQMEIFEQYFYDIEQLKRRSNDNYEYSSLDTLHEKISVFEVLNTNISLTASSNGHNVVTAGLFNFYKFGSISIKYGSNKLQQAERITVKQSRLYEKSYLTAGSTTRPYYFLQDDPSGSIIRFLPEPSTTDSVTINYIRAPKPVSWGYVIVANRPLFDPNPIKTQNFEIHLSDEVELVYKILKLAGVAIQRNDISQAGQVFETSQIQQEKLQ